MCAASAEQINRSLSSRAPTDPLPRGFHWLQVADIERQTRDAVAITFDIPKDLKKTYEFTQGQYLTLLREFDSESLRRPYSLCVSPASGVVRICSKQIPEGRMSGFLNQSLQVGDWLPVMEPVGNFFGAADTEEPHTYVGIAGGSGITPVMSILEHTLGNEPDSTFMLIYGNRASEDIIFRERLNDLKNQYLGRLQVIHVLSDELTDVPLLQGLLDSDKTEELIARFTNPADVSKFFICGPGPMMTGAEEALKRLAVSDDAIRIESFGAAQRNQAAQKIVTEGVPVAQAKVRIGGNTVNVKVPYDANVLDAALAARLDLPYACKGGVCCTCKARLISGEVEMAVNYGLEPDEIERGYILTCQSRPVTDTLEVDYDV